jgi:cyclic beta-1,2-glucan synthetase
VQARLELKPGETRDILFLLGQGQNAEQARSLVEQFGDPARAEAAYQAMAAGWEEMLEAIQVKTPDPALDLLLNRWLLYQAVACRLWGRTAFYQSGGGYGYRDQLQDVTALVFARPDLAREHILRAAAHQYEEGDVQHWWHPGIDQGARTRFSDDFLWLPFVTAHYVQATGDAAILDESVRFLKAPQLEAGQMETFVQSPAHAPPASLCEHCLRAIERGLAFGEHGLPLMGGGDWNDGMNRVGHQGHGESVWLGWFLYANLIRFAELVEARGDAERAARYRQEAERLRGALEEHAWDGAWYRRAYYDDGTPLGSASSDECQIDSIAQSWAVISGAASPKRVRAALEAVDNHLVRNGDGLILLLTPAFDRTSHDPGYIRGYLPGIRENGGQYTHAALWLILAHVLQGDGDRAARLFELINPIYHTRNPDEVARYKVEPYVIAADVYSHPMHTGRGGWTWYTGSSSWMYRVGLEGLLGLTRQGDRLRLNPCIPSHWPGYQIVYRHGDTRYEISVENGDGDGPRVTEASLDGSSLPDTHIPLLDDGGLHHVRVRLAASVTKA